MRPIYLGRFFYLVNLFIEAIKNTETFSVLLIDKIKKICYYISILFFGENVMKSVELFTDGACSGNPGRGGYGVILKYGENKKELSGGFLLTTNNRMELTAVIVGLKALKEPCAVDLYSDSKYITDALNKGWLDSWQSRGWKKADKSPVQNADLWRSLLPLIEMHNITWHWIKGHDGHPENERCDFLARTAYSGENLSEDSNYSGEI